MKFSDIQKNQFKNQKLKNQLKKSLIDKISRRLLELEFKLSH